MEIKMNKQDYQKEKNNNKTQFKASCVTSFEQELSEVQELHSHVVDFYYAEHWGCWVLRSELDEFDMNEYDTKKELFNDLEATNGLSLIHI